MSAIDYERIDQIVESKVRSVFAEQARRRTESWLRVFYAASWLLAGVSIATAIFVALQV